MLSEVSDHWHFARRSTDGFAARSLFELVRAQKCAGVLREVKQSLLWLELKRAVAGAEAVLGRSIRTLAASPCGREGCGRSCRFAWGRVRTFLRWRLLFRLRRRLGCL